MTSDRDEYMRRQEQDHDLLRMRTQNGPPVLSGPPSHRPAGEYGPTKAPPASPHQRADDLPAFPQSLRPDGPFGGMTLRDWFAGQALVGLVNPGWETDAEAAPAMAFRIADAMLAERAHGESQ